LGFQSDQLSNLFSGPSRVWTFVPQVSQPIFTAGRLKSGVQSAKAQQEFAIVQYQQTTQNAFREVSDALIQYRKEKERFGHNRSCSFQLYEIGHNSHNSDTKEESTHF